MIHRRIIFFALAACLVVPVASPAQFRVLIFHAHENLGYDVARFTEHMDFLATNGFHTATADDLLAWRVERRPMPLRPILLTVDDNYIKVWTEMFAILAPRGQHMVNFTPTGLVGLSGGLQYATWPQIAAMEADGAIVTESHTVSHPHLTQLAPAAAQAEIVNSKAAIEAALPGKTCRYIAYSYGDYDASIITMCQQAGYAAGFAVGGGINTPATPLFELQRIAGDVPTLADFKIAIGFHLLPPPPPGPGWIIDNNDVNCFADSGLWLPTSTGSAHLGVDFRARGAGDGSDPIKWAAYLPEGGRYRVHAWWPARPTSATDARWRIEHAGGALEVTSNLRENGSQWNLLGEVTFTTAAPAAVLLSDLANGPLVADAVWFEPMPLPQGWMMH